MPARRHLLSVLSVLLLAAVSMGILIASGGGDWFAGAAAIATRTPTATATPTPTVTPSPSPEPSPSPTETPLPLPTATFPPPPPSSQVEAATAPPRHEAGPSSAEGWDYDFAAQTLVLVNQERAARGLGQLAENANLARAAEDYARVLIDLDELTHEAHGTTLRPRADAAGYYGVYVGEVLWSATAVFPPERAVSDWLASPSHAHALLNPVYVEAGTGCYVRRLDTMRSICVIEFGAP